MPPDQTQTPQPQTPLRPHTPQPVPYLSRYALSAGLVTKGRLSVLGAVIIVAGALALMSSEKRTAFSPGQLTNAHSLFDNDCGTCHQSVWHSIPDRACQSCHAGPVHHANQAFTPGCATCHLEHRGRDTALVALEEKFCTRCHADLTRSAKTVPSFADQIQSFGTDHPEFAISVHTSQQHAPVRVRLDNTAQLIDMAQVEFNHAIHLEPDLPSPQGFEQLSCSSCHQTDEHGAYMLPIRYEQHCQRCHVLEFDPRFPKQSVPHDEPAVIHTFLVGTFTQYYLDQTPEMAESLPSAPLRRRPDRPLLQSLPKPLRQRIEWTVQETERLLFRGVTCRTCHQLTRPEKASDASLPTVVPTAIPQRWLPHSQFNHQAHTRTGRSCESCHVNAQTSEETQDVLLPGIAVCQECHSTTGGVNFSCMSCHQYHDRDRPLSAVSTIALPAQSESSAAGT